jgi:hypothetical protein
MNNDTIKLIRKTSNVNSLMVIIFYMLDIALIRLGDLSVYHIALEFKTAFTSGVC